jgi:alkylation response protein AidB-like acyl-CoA dehydrogenase
MLETELRRRDAPVAGGAARLGWPAVDAYGDPGLRAELKPGLARGTVRFTLGYTEPDGGSDIAGPKPGRSTTAANGSSTGRRSSPPAPSTPTTPS